jgi:hypothetical protein
VASGIFSPFGEDVGRPAPALCSVVPVMVWLLSLRMKKRRERPASSERRGGTLAAGTHSASHERPEAMQIWRTIGRRIAALSRREKARAAAFSSSERAESEASPNPVRAAGPDAMRDPPERWEKVDQQVDESLPASDPATQY